MSNAGQKPDKNRDAPRSENGAVTGQNRRMQAEKTTAQKPKGRKAALSEIQKRNTGREKTSGNRTAIDSGKEKMPAYDRHRKEAGAEMIAAPGKGGIHADDRVGNGGISGQSKKPEKCKSRFGSSAESAGTGTIAEP